MTVYVDPLMNHGMKMYGRQVMSCHMFADTVEELHSMADLIGMKRSWFQDKRFPHYDLVAGKRKKALDNGTIPLSRRTAVEFFRRKKWGIKSGGDLEPPNGAYPAWKEIANRAAPGVAMIAAGHGVVSSDSSISIDPPAITESLGIELAAFAREHPENKEARKVANVILEALGREPIPEPRTSGLRPDVEVVEPIPGPSDHLSKLLRQIKEEDAVRTKAEILKGLRPPGGRVAQELRMRGVPTRAQAEAAGTKFGGALADSIKEKIAARVAEMRAKKRLEKVAREAKMEAVKVRAREIVRKAEEKEEK